METPEDLKFLEDSRPEVVEEAKKRFHEYFNNTKESWLLNGLVDFYVATGSLRCADVIVCVREPHDTYFFNKMSDSLRNSSSRLSILTLLSHVVLGKPTWLYKIAQHNLFRDLLKVLKMETDIIIQISALLTLVVLLPMIPAYVGTTLPEIFEVFSRLAAWNANNTNKLPEDQLVHLQVSLHSLFHRLYGMYPCNFLSFLRQQYGARENLAIFSHTIKPMLDTVKMHPLLVTTSKETETTTTRWKKMEHHDVVVECARLSVDSKDENVPPSGACLNPRSESELRRILENAGYHDLKSSDSEKIEYKDLWSPSLHGSAITPPVPLSAEPASIPQTPIPQTYVVSSSLSQEVGTSPPEAAIEATPETTPVKDPRLYTARGPAQVNTSGVVRALNNLGSGKWNSAASTPSTSQPSSPMKKELSPFRFPETAATESRLVQRKVELLMHERNMLGKGGMNGTKAEEYDEDQEVLEISQHGEMRITANIPGSTRQCDSVLQDFHPPHGEDLEPCEQESGSPCPSGGLHMPNSRSLMHFRQRLRYYSQCNNDLKLSPSNSSWQPRQRVEEYNELMPAVVRRAKSCPEIKKKPSSLVASDDDLDDTLEIERTMVSTCTQTGPEELPPPLPYDHMFQALFPGPVVEDEQAPASRPGSPSTILDRYLDKASFHRVPETSSKTNVSALESELRTARDHLVLLHLQLKFERHRRDIHDERNRRLLGKSRHNRSLEEHNSALRDQIGLVDSELKCLHEEMFKSREDSKKRERNLLEETSFWQEKSTNLEKENRELKSEIHRRDIDREHANQQSTQVDKRLQHVEAQLFSVGKELKEAAAQASAGEALKLQLTYLHKELVVMGEQYSRARDILAKASLRSGHFTQLCQDSYTEQVRGLTLQVDAKVTNFEAARSRVAELEAALGRKDSVVAEQKRTLKAVKEECTEKLEAVEIKYKSQLAINRKLESTLLELTGKLDIVTKQRDVAKQELDKARHKIDEANQQRDKTSQQRRGKVSAAQDVLKVADGGGVISSPLSVSHSSSEGVSLSSMANTDSTLARDLFQSVIDSPEVSCTPELVKYEEMSGLSSSSSTSRH